MRRPVISLLTALIAGITAGSMAHIPGSVALPFLLVTLGTMLFLVATGRRGCVHACLLLSLFLVGILSINLYLHPRPGGDDITLHAGKGRLTVEGVVCAPPRVRSDRTMLAIETARVVQKGTAVSVRGKILLSVKDSNNVFKYGNYIRVHTKLKEPRSFDNPGGFDYKEHLLYQGIRLRGYISKPSDIVILRERAGNAFRTKLEKYRSLIRKRIRETAPSPEGDVLQALILGEKESIPEDIIQNFNRTGVSHILAISGLHVGIIACISLFIATALMKSSEYLLLRLNVFKASALLAVMPVIGYAFIAGLRISTVRAAIMILCYLVALLAGRGRDLLNILAFAAFLILVFSPPSLFDVSFQLSFTAVAAIILITPALNSLIPQATGKDALGRGINAAVLFILVSSAAVVGTAPLIAFYFNRISTISLISNLCVIPAIGFAVLPLGMLLILAAPFAPAASFLATIASFFVGIVLSIIEFLSSFPLASLPVATPTLLEIVVYYLGLLAGVRLINRWSSKEDEQGTALRSSSIIQGIRECYRYREKTILALCLGVFVLFFVAHAVWTNLSTATDQDLHVTFLDVGQGSSTLIRFPGGTAMVVDGGGFYDRGFDLGRYVVGPYLWRHKIKRIDIMVLTHPDQDHVGGLPFLAENFEVGEFWSNGEESENESSRSLWKIIREKRIPHRIVGSDTPERIVGGASIRILNPRQPPPGKSLPFAPSDHNNSGVVMKITLGGRSVLLPADISEPAEAYLLNSGSDLRADVLMVPHHGGHTSSTAPFIEAVRPGIAVISCGKDNTFGFPHPSVLDRYARAGARVLRTDRDGAVIVRTDGVKLEIMRPR